MITDMTRAVQGGLRQERKMETISNHLANVNSTGFKADIMSFDSMLNARMTMDLSQGDLRMTGNPLDIALSDKGFFKIETARGIRYTRDGNFTLNTDNNLVTQDGQIVLGESGSLTLEGKDISIDEQGEIRVDGKAAGKLEIVDFMFPEKLRKEGDSYFVYSGPVEDEEIVPERVSVKQNYLEGSNVTTVVEMVKMIETMRSYESFQKTIQAIDETDAKAINEVGKPA